MRTLTKWTAKRAGGRITVYGWEQREGEAQGHEVKVVSVDKIEPDPSQAFCLATTKDGEQVKLTVGIYV